VDGIPHLTGGSAGASSRWHIPAGVSGALAGEDEQRAVKSAAAQGYDNYDGALFIVYDGRVQGPFPWTSFTSWESLQGTTDHPGASIRGNADYVVNSFRSSSGEGRVFRNFCFRVTDKNLPFVSGGVGDADSVDESRFYYRPNPSDLVTDNTDGQSQIRLHAGQKTGSTAEPGSGSAGCLVSVQFGAMRSRLIAIYKDEYRQSHNAEDHRFDDLALKVSTPQSQAYYSAGSLKTGWDNAIVGQLWLIRPDERPLG
jgi:hypothetical protein